MNQTTKPAEFEPIDPELKRQLEQMYIRTEHWISDFEFFKDEMSFLINLIDRHFIALLINDGAKLNLIKDASRNLIALDNQRESIARENKENLDYLASILKNEVAFDPEEFKDSQADLEADQVNFVKQYRSLKKEIFDLAEHLHKLSKAGFLLND